MPSGKDNILEFSQYMKSNKMPYIIYADIEPLVKKIDGCANNQENCSTTNFEKKKMIPLSKEEIQSHQDAKICCICEIQHM